MAEAPGWLRRPGTLLVEVAPTQTDAAVALAVEAGFDTAEFRHDMSGRPRFLVARFS